MDEKKDRETLTGRRAAAALRACCLAAAIMSAMGAAWVRAQEQEKEPIPLAEQLRGLEPGPRIAYLRHLMDGGNADPEVFFQLAVAYHESSMNDSAIAYYKRTVREDPGHFKAWVNLGVLFDDLGNSLEAEGYFRSAVSVKPDDVLANSHLAFILFEHKNYDEAWGFLSRAIETGPDNPQPRFYLAIFFFECNMYREAMNEWERVVSLAPGSYLAARALENISMLQNAMNSPVSPGQWEPKR